MIVGSAALGINRLFVEPIKLASAYLMPINHVPISMSAT
jgi:hypothetical protein